MSFTTFKDVVSRVDGLASPCLIAIDGLPVSGKSTLAQRLRQRLGLDCIYLDDFVRPQADWPTRTRPAFPFEYIRYDTFLAAIKSLALTGECAFHPFDWATLAIAPEPRRVWLDAPVIIEGVSSLNVEVRALYGLKIFVDSDRATTLEAAAARGVGEWGPEWAQLFLPSADLYMESAPRSRADLVYAGRGAGRQS